MPYSLSSLPAWSRRHKKIPTLGSPSRRYVCTESGLPAAGKDYSALLRDPGIILSCIKHPDLLLRFEILRFFNAFLSLKPSGLESQAQKNPDTRLAESSGCLRRERDSNPRYDHSHTRFPSVLLKPLGHLSKWVAKLTKSIHS